MTPRGWSLGYLRASQSRAGPEARIVEAGTGTKAEAACHEGRDRPPFNVNELIVGFHLQRTDRCSFLSPTKAPGPSVIGFQSLTFWG